MVVVLIVVLERASNSLGLSWQPALTAALCSMPDVLTVSEESLILQGGHLLPTSSLARTHASDRTSLI